MNVLQKYEPKFFSIINKYIIFNNYSISYFKGGFESFGNNIQQIANAIIYCNLHGYNFYLKNHPYINDFKVINDRRSNLFSFFKKKYRFFYFNKEVTNFFNKKEFFNKNENDFPITESEKIIFINEMHDTVKKYIKPNLNFCENQEIADDTLVIHIRSGDVFDDDWHSMYVQNPLSYYEKLISKYAKTIIVTSDEKNPVIEKLKDKKNITISSSTFENDLNVLLNAKNLASSGVGTFVLSAALLSEKIENYYCSQYFLEEHLNPEMIKNVTIKKLFVHDYIDIGNFKKTKNNIEKLVSDKITITENYE